MAISEEDLDAAVAAGVIAPTQRDALVAFVRGRAPVPVTDEERFRVLGGFNDILVAIGLGLLVAALVGASSWSGNVFVVALAALAIAWGLAEVFTRRLRLALPSILLSLMFCGTAAILFGGSLYGVLEEGLPIWAGLMVALAAALHWWRFRVPIDVALIAAGLAALLVGALTRIDVAAATPAFIVTGLAVFVVAMGFDTRDPGRRTVNADIAFWLHLLAAPLIVHPVATSVFALLGDAMAAWVIVLALVAALALVALVIDRRALLVSGLGYAGYALWSLFDRLGGGDDVTLTVTLALLAVVVLAVSAGWTGLRRLIVPLVPLGSVRDRLPPLRA